MIGIIVKAEKEVEELGQDWIPSTFCPSDLSKAFEKVLGYAPKLEEFCYEEGKALIYFTIDDLAEPRAITFSCSMTEYEADIIKRISCLLGAKLYDSEAGVFIAAENV